MIVSDSDALAAMFRRMDQSDVAVVDMETNGVDPFGLSDRREGEKELGPARICGLTLGVPLGKELFTFYVPSRHETSEPQMHPSVYADIAGQIKGKKVIGHQLKFDLQMWGFDGRGFDDRHIETRDTMILEHVLHETSARDDWSGEDGTGFSLANMAQRYNRHNTAWKSWVRDEFRSRGLRRYSQFTVQELAPYAEDDVYMTWINHEYLYPKLFVEEEPWYGGTGGLLPSGRPRAPHLESVFKEDMRLLWTLMRMEYNGMQIDRDECYRQIELLKQEAINYAAKLDTISGGGINYNSTKQLKELFLRKDWPLPINDGSTTPHFSDIHMAKAAERAGNPVMSAFVNDLYNWKRCTKFRSTYFEAYLNICDENGLLHPDFYQHGTITGRLSCHKPNFQNIPNRFGVTRSALKRDVSEITAQAEVKRVIVPRDDDHRIHAFDYSQQEMRMFLHFAKEPAMEKVILEGGDVHELAAEALYNEPMPKDKNSTEYGRRRLQAKVINFGILYGMGPKKLADSMEISQDQAKTLYQNYLRAFPGIKETVRKVNDVADARLWIHLAFGRRRRFRLLTEEEISRGYVMGNLGKIKIWEGKRAFGSHKALNHLIQGSCAELTRRSMNRVDELLRGTKSYLINSIHDELVYDLHVDEQDALLPEIKRCMEDWPQFRIPFKTDHKPSKRSWAECEKVGS